MTIRTIRAIEKLVKESGDEGTMKYLIDQIKMRDYMIESMAGNIAIYSQTTNAKVRSYYRAQYRAYKRLRRKYGS